MRANRTRNPKPAISWKRGLLTAVALTGLLSAASVASSHREAPGVSKRPQVDATDLYAFRSYESGRGEFVTLIANYNPLQDPFGGPNYFPLDPAAYYDIHIDNDGDCEEDWTFRLSANQDSPFLSLSVGDAGSEESVAVPLSNIGPFGAGDTSALNVRRTYRLLQLRGPVSRFNHSVALVRNADTGSSTFEMPFDNIGEKSIPDYDGYADQFLYNIDIPHCPVDGRLFVGQRKDSFAVNLGEVFDLVNTNPLGDPAAEPSDTANKNVTTIALEVPIECITSPENAAEGATTIAAWTTARLPRVRLLRSQPGYNSTDVQFGKRQQVSRLANPLANEVVIGLPDKDLFNSSHPTDDGQFLTYVTHPTLPELIEILFGVTAPNLFPREDLIQIFLTGIPGLNQDGGACELMRLNTAIDPVPAASQSPLGVLGGDLAGYPNGRRPGDDTVDISLRAVMGVLLPAAVAPDGQLPYTDGTAQNASMFDDQFPYLTTPLAGSPNTP